MKFIVRKGFVCHVDTPQLDDKGKVTDVIRNTFPGGKAVDFDEKTAGEHRHKLEADQSDIESVAFLAPASIEVVSIDAKQVERDHAAAMKAAAAAQ